MVYIGAYLEKDRALIALLLVVSPHMLFYGRYVRNESYTAWVGFQCMPSSYIETGGKRYLMSRWQQSSHLQQKRLLSSMCAPCSFGYLFCDPHYKNPGRKIMAFGAFIASSWQNIFPGKASNQ
jgi:hypothetical protein